MAPVNRFFRKRAYENAVQAGWGAFLVAALLIGGVSAKAEHTRRWRQSSYEEFLRGTAKGVAVRSDGRLELAPKFTHLGDADAPYLWALRIDSKGMVYTTGGTPAKVFRIDAGGKATTVFESGDISAQAIAFDAKGTLFVGTSPDGKVYRVSANGEKTVFFEPKTKYIWDLAFGADGTLYVATGDKGQIFAVTPDGKSSLFYASDEAHIKALAFDGKGNLIAGTEPSGRVLRMTARNGKNAKKDESSGNAEGFVLYETAKREVTSLAVGADGTIYAGAIGDKPRTTGPANPAIVTSPAVVTNIGGNITVAGGGAVQGAAAFAPFPPALTSAIYRIGTDGAPEELWSSRDDLVYALGIAADGRLLAGTGNNGALLAIDRRGVFAQLAKAGSAQITGIARGADSKVFLCTANPGKIFSLGPEYEDQGTYESKPFDAQLFSQWGRLEWWGPPPPVVAGAKGAVNSGEPRVKFFVRAGNTEDPGKEWSRWMGPYAKPGAVEAPPARFAQWKAVIHDGRPGDGLDWVTLAYLPRNVAPVIDGIVVQEPGVRAQGQMAIQAGQQQGAQLKMPPAASVGGVVITQSSGPQKFDTPPQGFVQKGFLTVVWSAHDDNDDDLRFAVYFRGEKETEWKLLKDGLDQKFYSWDATGMPDGAYYLKIVASDAPSNPPERALKAERESERFEIDNTPPVIEKLEAVNLITRGGQSPEFRGILVRFEAQDAASSVERAQYSVDGGEWVLVAPKGGISDAPTESYEFVVPMTSAGEHTIAVRAYDHFENAGSAKATVRVPAERR